MKISYKKQWERGDRWLVEAEVRQPFGRLLLGRLLRPDDIVSLVGYLLREQAEMVTGSVIDYNQ